MDVSTSKSQRADAASKHRRSKAQSRRKGSSHKPRSRTLRKYEDSGDSAPTEEKIKHEDEVQVSPAVDDDELEVSVCIWGIPRDWETHDLSILVFACGDSASVRMGPAAGKSHKYAFVKFQTPEDARRAISLLNGRKLHDTNLVVKLAKPPQSSGKTWCDSCSRRRLTPPLSPGTLPSQPLPASLAHHTGQFLAPLASPMMGMEGGVMQTGIVHPGVEFVRPVQQVQQLSTIQPTIFLYPPSPSGPGAMYGQQQIHEAMIPQGAMLAPTGQEWAPTSPSFEQPQFAQASSDPQTRTFGRSLSPFPHQSQTNIYVGNLPESITEDRLGAIFGACGIVLSCKVLLNRFTGRPLGTALVRMAEPEQANLCIHQLGGSIINGRRIYCRFANERKTRRSKSSEKKSRSDDKLATAKLAKPMTQRPRSTSPRPSLSKRGSKHSLIGSSEA